MSEGRLPAAFALSITVLAVVSGPLVGPVDLTARGDTLGDGNANVSVVSVPTTQITLERGDFGAGRYHLTAPPAVVNVNHAEGNPVVRYTIDIPKLWITATSRYELAGKSGTRLELRPEPIGISPQKVDQDSYEVIVAIWVREGDLETSILQERVTIEVRR